MMGYLVRKIIYALIILYVIASLNFVIFQVISPLDPAKAFARNPMLSPEYQEAMARLWGLDQPLSTRYVKYIINMFTLNFGISFMKQIPVIEEMLPRLRNTLILLSLSLTFNVLVGVSVGVLAASKRGTKVDAFAMSAGLFAWGAPIFYIQLLFVFFLANPSFFMLFPRGGMTTLPPPTDPIAYIADLAYHMALPLITLVVAQFGWWALYIRNMMLDALTEDYVDTARAVGLSERKVLFGHAFRATLPPFVTMVALIIPTLLMGGILTEYIFSWPGTGQWFLYSVENGDYPAAQALLFLYAVLMVGGNFAVDLIYGFLDPRIRVGVRR
jgi:peptide/nickel transport system permease protein